MSDEMHARMTWSINRVVWNMTDMLTLWLSGVPPLSGSLSWLGMVAPLVLYSPAVSCSDCCQIAVRLWIAMGLVGLWLLYFVCVGAVDGGVRCAIVFHNRPLSVFDVAQTGNIFGGVGWVNMIGLIRSCNRLLLVERNWVLGEILSGVPSLCGLRCILTCEIPCIMLYG